MIFLDGTVNEGIFDHNVFQGPSVVKNEDILEESYESDGNNYNVNVGKPIRKFLLSNICYSKRGVASV